MEEKLQALGIRILQNCRNELYSYFPYLDGAFACLSYQAEKDVQTIETDGEKIYFSPDFLIQNYCEDPVKIKRGYLHMLLHCLYLHLFSGEEYEEKTWDLACDLAVEYIIEKEQIPGLSLPTDPVREKCFWILREQLLSAENLCSLLKRKAFPFSEEELEAVFSFDAHRRWRDKKNPERRAKTRQKWEKTLLYTGQQKQERKQRAGRQKGSGEEELSLTGRSRYDYKKFLKRFSVPREEVELDTESFDYIFYHLGMETYGNLPLIEPLEYKEVNRLEELVIAIDTSGSCQMETVRQFLEETYSILSEKENFFRKMKVYLIQCDCCVQDVQVIRCEEEWKSFSKNIKIQGRGGTDFRPVFQYVKEQREKKELQNLKALIYFTDGDGIYPRCRPEYETAFVFVEKTKGMSMAPAWALKLLVR